MLMMFKILSDPTKKEAFDSRGFDYTADYENSFDQSKHGASYDPGEVFKNIFGRFSRGSPFADMFRNSTSEVDSIPLTAKVHLGCNFGEPIYIALDTGGVNLYGSLLGSQKDCVLSCVGGLWRL